MLIIRNGVIQHSLQTIESVIVVSADQITKYFIAESNYPPPIKKSTLNYLDYYPYYILVDQEKKFCSLLYYICREFCTSEDYGNQISALNIIKILLNSKENNTDAQIESIFYQEEYANYLVFPLYFVDEIQYDNPRMLIDRC